MSNNVICHICDSNLSYAKYDGKKLLDEDGNKPCLECMLEADLADEEEDEE